VSPHLWLKIGGLEPVFGIFCKKKTKNIILVGANTGRMLRAIRTSFIETLNENSGPDYFFSFINGENDENYLEKILEETLSGTRYDLIVSFGKTSTQIAKRLTIKNRTYTPIVFSGVLNPVDSSLVQSELYSGNHLTGISAPARDYEEQIDKLIQIMCNRVKKVVIVHSSLVAQHSPQEIDGAFEAFKKRGITTLRAEIGSSGEAQKKIGPLLDVEEKPDIVFMPRDSIVANEVGDITALCNTHRVPLYASDFESVKSGAALGFGFQEGIIGKATAQKALPILLQNISPSSIPVSELSGWNTTMMLNTASMSSQGLTVCDRGLSSVEEILTI